MRSDDILVSVIMPVYRQEKFMKRAIASLFAQQYRNWELIVINDGGEKDLFKRARPTNKITYLLNEKNQGLGYSLNRAMQTARGELIAYLPADDIYYPDHLQTLAESMTENPDAALCYSSFRHHYNRVAEHQVNGYYQLVQVMHRRTDLRWMERQELESDHLGWLFWDKLEGERIHTGKLTCEWTDHPLQRHKIMQEPLGGINAFRQYYKVRTPLRFHSTKGHLMDEQNRYMHFRKAHYPEQNDGLRILIVGELAYNAERVIALAEAGHKLYGLWMREPYWYNYVGPLPFGHVRDIDERNWEEEVRRIKPDVIYGCLNWQAVPFVNKVAGKFPEIPFCWHFKEGPFICIEKGTWNELMSLYERAQGRIYCSDEMKAWFDEFLEPSENEDLVLDGDLPKKDWFNQPRTPLLSEGTGGIHTVVPGRPIGLHPPDVALLASQDIHLHFYGEFTHGQWKEWIATTSRLAPGHLHIHPNVSQEDWVQEFSRYDAGWLHYFESENEGLIAKANWDDLNIPARMATLALAGLPMIQYDNSGHLVATQTLAKRKGTGVFTKDLGELGSLLSNRPLIEHIREHVWNTREDFTFDHHVDVLIDYFRTIIARFQGPGKTKHRSPLKKLH
jgi:glycosyltransferase involved in cell wall biosynthesis